MELQRWLSNYELFDNNYILFINKFVQFSNSYVSVLVSNKTLKV